MACTKIKRGENYVSGSIIVLVTNFRGAIGSTASLLLQCTLSGIMFTASCLRVTVNLIGLLGQVKLNPPTAEDAWKQYKLPLQAFSSWHVWTSIQASQQEDITHSTHLEVTHTEAILRWFLGSRCSSWLVKGICKRKAPSSLQCLTILMTALTAITRYLTRFHVNYWEPWVHSPHGFAICPEFGWKGMNISIEPQRAQSFRSRWIKQKKSLRGVRKRS